MAAPRRPAGAYIGEGRGSARERPLKGEGRRGSPNRSGCGARGGQSRESARGEREGASGAGGGRGECLRGERGRTPDGGKGRRHREDFAKGLRDGRSAGRGTAGGRKRRSLLRPSTHVTVPARDVTVPVRDVTEPALSFPPSPRPTRPVTELTGRTRGSRENGGGQFPPRPQGGGAAADVSEFSRDPARRLAHVLPPFRCHVPSRQRSSATCPGTCARPTRHMTGHPFFEAKSARIGEKNPAAPPTNRLHRSLPPLSQFQNVFGPLRSSVPAAGGAPRAPLAPPPPCPAPPGAAAAVPGSNDVFVTSRSDFRAQLRRCQRLLAPGGGPGGAPGELRLHGLGLAVPRTINLALQLQAGAGGALRLHASTSSVPLRDHRHRHRERHRERPDSADSGDGDGDNPRHNSAIHIRLCREAPCA
ncbi:ribonuclease P protein subunit p20 [Molothrus aeneus]|uniref:ribonuclease P protein subunit p20 n=1 Tax=Molothrus aeneus TaxID=84833 RepID=UPI00345A5821